MSSPPSNDKHGPSGIRVLVARLVWMFFAPMSMVVSGIKIVESGTGWLTNYDAVFFCGAGLVLVMKWYELRSGEGCDAYGQPASLASYSGFVRAFTPLAVGAWVLANLFGNHLLN